MSEQYPERIDRLLELARRAWRGVGGIDVTTEVDQYGVHAVVVQFEPEEGVFEELLILRGATAEWVLDDAEVCLAALAQARDDAAKP